MDILKAISDELRQVINKEIKNTLDEMVKQYTEDKWLDKKQLAKYWGVSESYINKKLDEIPHSATTPIAFKKSLADEWRMGEVKKAEISNLSKVSIKNYKKNSFKVGK